MYQFQQEWEEKLEQEQIQEQEHGEETFDRFQEAKEQGKSTQDLFAEMFMMQK